MADSNPPKQQTCNGCGKKAATVIVALPDGPLPLCADCEVMVAGAAAMVGIRLRGTNV